MSTFLEFLRQSALSLGYVWVWLICAVGIVISCIGISGTWLVVIAALIAAVLSGAGFPGLGTILFFIYLAILVEVAEVVAGAWGVKKRGGSGWAGFMAVVGGLAGLFLGSVIPIPVIGGLLGMLAGSFALVYAVEVRRLRKSGAAAHIAMGAVLARVLVILMKTLATLGMTTWLAIGLASK
jgi:uncharacterized protein YqgC (DUF456 family)